MSPPPEGIKGWVENLWVSNCEDQLTIISFSLRQAQTDIVIVTLMVRQAHHDVVIVTPNMSH